MEGRPGGYVQTRGNRRCGCGPEESELIPFCMFAAHFGTGWGQALLLVWGPHKDVPPKGQDKISLAGINWVLTEGCCPGHWTLGQAHQGLQSPTPRPSICSPPQPEFLPARGGSWQLLWAPCSLQEACGAGHGPSRTMGLTPGARGDILPASRGRWWGGDSGRLRLSFHLLQAAWCPCLGG